MKERRVLLPKKAKTSVESTLQIYSADVGYGGGTNVSHLFAIERTEYEWSSSGVSEISIWDQA
jgi:hypothetical protein